MENTKEIKELDVHKVFIDNPNIFEKILGLKIDKDSIEHHYPLSEKGDHIDFVFKDSSGLTYLVEVKLNASPISVIPQLLDHEYKKFIEMNSTLDKNLITPVIVIDNESVTDQDKDIFSRMNIKLCTYKLTEIEEVLKEVITIEPPVLFEPPELEKIEDIYNKTKILHENFGDINILLEGFRGEKWWEGHYEFVTFWMWKKNKYPNTFKKIFKMLCKGDKEDCIWFTFLTALADAYEVAEYMIFDKKWTWSNVISAKQDKLKWGRFEDCLCDSGRWYIKALFGHDKRKQVVKDYLEKVGNNQEKYFLDIISKSDNPYDAYNHVWESIKNIHNIGNVVAGEFATYISQWRVLPIIPSDHVRESKFVRKALDSLGIRKPMESYRDALLRMAKKYSVTPIVIERAMHKLGRVREKK